MKELEGKVALITGAGRGMGRSHAKILAEQGAEIIVQDIDAKLASETIEEIRAGGGKAVEIICDVADISTLTQKIDETELTVGQIDILVNNAGIDRMAQIEDIDERAFDLMIGVHLKGSFFAAKAVIPGMKQRKWGRIINISSTGGLTGIPNDTHYSSAKAGLLGFTKALAKELAPFNITVNAIAPGAVMTEMVLSKCDTRQAALDRIEKRLKDGVIPLGRYAEPEEISYVVKFLASPQSGFMTGQVISPNGGEVIVGI